MKDLMMANYVPCFLPAFLVAVGFMDPGNWVTLIEGGSRFGYELGWVVLAATLLAMLLQTVSARLGVVTGKHFAELCREELPRGVCILLWIFCEMSIITLDLTMVLGTAIGLNIVLRIPILPSLLLMIVDSLLFIAVLPLMEIKRALYISVGVVGIALVFILQDIVPTGTLPIALAAGLLPKLRHETLYVAVSIVGANVMPHNFYLHSALVKDQSRTSQPTNTLSEYCTMGTLLSFGAVLVVNLAIFSVAVSELHDTGLVVLTLQDAQAFIEQILNNSICPALFGLALLCAGQLSTLNGGSAGHVVSEGFFDYTIQPWQHRILIRVVSLVPVAALAHFYDNEGIYQMVMFSQVLMVLVLPFTVAPLIKLTSSERIMGSHKNSLFLETLAWLALTILSAVNVTLTFDLVFGELVDGANFGGFEYMWGFDWLTEVFGENLQSVVFGAISAGTTLSLGFLVWLIFTPLELDNQLTRPSWIEEYARQEKKALGTKLSVHTPFVDSLPPAPNSVNSVESMERDEPQTKDLSIVAVSQTDSGRLELQPKEGADADSSAAINIQDFPEIIHVEDSLDDGFQQHQPSSPSASSVVGSPIGTSPGSSVITMSLVTPEAIEQVPVTEDTTEAVALKKAEAEADADAELLGKEEDEIDQWGTLEQDQVLADAHDVNVNGSVSYTLLDGPLSGRSDTSIGSEGGTGSGSLSRLSGLGRAARRQFALILDDFWSTLFDLHGHPLAAQSKVSSQAPGRLNGESRGASIAYDGSDYQKLQAKSPSLSWKKQRNLSDQPRSMDANMLRASTASQLPQGHSREDGISLGYKSERRHMSVHMPVYHEDYDYQPATIHGYRTPSFPGRAGNAAAMQTARAMHLGGSLYRPQTSLGPGQYGSADMSSMGVGYHNLFESRRQVLKSQWAADVAGHGGLYDNNGSKYVGESESYDSNRRDPLANRSRDSSTGRWDPLVHRATGELDLKNLGLPHELNRWANFGNSPIGRGGQGAHVESAPLVFDEISPSQSLKDGFSIQTPTSKSEPQSLWSRQPFEQLFGATDVDNPEIPVMTGDTQKVEFSESDSTVSAGVEIEVDVLERLQICLVKLLRVDGSDWLFRRDNGADEDLITAIAMAQKALIEAELSELHRSVGHQEQQGSDGNNRSHARRGINDSVPLKRQLSIVPNCGKGCVWDHSLLVSFGVWCVHRILELSLMESRPELWGKYTYVLNRLQGILEPAFAKPRLVPVFCRCVTLLIMPDVGKRKITKLGSVHDHGNGDALQSYPHPWPWGKNTSYLKGKGLSATTCLDMIKEVETAVGSRKGRTGTAAGDVAFPKGKENLASVLKRYKRRLSSKLPGSTGPVNGGRKV